MRELSENRKPQLRVVQFSGAPVVQKVFLTVRGVPVDEVAARAVSDDRTAVVMTTESATIEMEDAGSRQQGGCLGILTGISYVSGVDYYRGINDKYTSMVPKKHIIPPNPTMLMASVDCDV